MGSYRCNARCVLAHPASRGGTAHSVPVVGEFRISAQLFGMAPQSDDTRVMTCAFGHFTQSTWMRKVLWRCGERPYWPRQCSAVKPAAISITRSSSVSGHTSRLFQQSALISSSFMPRPRREAMRLTGARLARVAWCPASRYPSGKFSTSGRTCWPRSPRAVLPVLSSGVTSNVQHATLCSVP